MQRQRSFYVSYVKRVLDLLGALFAILLLWPLLVGLYSLMWFSVGPPVLFRQHRPGYRAKPFAILKFRTMSSICDDRGNLLPDEKRVTRVGAILRSLSLDELPELFNVIKGEMSFVGPRPLMMRYLARYTPEQARRHDAMPGIAGWAQINGRNAITWEEKFRLDVWYVDNQSFMLDVRILAKSIWKVLRREGISEQGHVSASEFMGTTTQASDGEGKRLRVDSQRSM